MKEEENVVNEDEYDVKSSFFGKSFVSKLRVRLKKKIGF